VWTGPIGGAFDIGDDVLAECFRVEVLGLLFEKPVAGIFHGGSSLVEEEAAGHARIARKRLQNTLHRREIPEPILLVFRHGYCSSPARGWDADVPDKSTPGQDEFQAERESRRL